MKMRILLCALCAAGGALVGFNGGRLNQPAGIALFVAGLGMVNLSIVIMGIRKGK